TLALLARLNPDRDLARLQPGESIELPNVPAPDSIFAHPPQAASLEVDLSHKTITALDENSRPLAQFHCSIAKFAAKRPRGSAEVKVIALKPEYLFDPAMWPEVKDQ